MVETASVGGMIVAPVFVQVDAMRLVNHHGTLIRQADPFKRTCYFLGLMDAAWNIGNKDGDLVRENGSGSQINQGIAIIVPARKIMEIIIQPGPYQIWLAIVDEEYKKKFVVENRPLVTQDSLEGAEDVQLTSPNRSHRKPKEIVIIEGDCDPIGGESRLYL